MKLRQSELNSLFIWLLLWGKGKGKGRKKREKGKRGEN
jgi:hypothetical protein